MKSAADWRLGNEESDRYVNTAFAGRLGITPSEFVDGALYLRAHDVRADLDSFGGAGGDDPNRLLKSRELFTRGEVNLHWLEKRLTQSLFIDFSDHDLRDDDDPDAGHPLDRLRSSYDGRLFKYGLLNFFEASKMMSFTVGLEGETERGSSGYRSESAFGPFVSNLDEHGAHTNGYFAQTRITPSEVFSTTFGIRTDDHSKFGSETTWRIAPTLYIPSTETKISATVGTGYKAPSLFQLYSSYGNLELEPEKSIGVDAGVEQSFLGDSIKVS
jgi:vitamin B12 transporter